MMGEGKIKLIGIDSRKTANLSLQFCCYRQVNPAKQFNFIHKKEIKNN